MDANETLCKNPSCRHAVVQVGGGHRKREYCDDNCRQMAHRARREADLRQQCIARVQAWGNFQDETIALLAGLLYAGNEEFAHRIAEIVQREQGQNAGSLDRNTLAYQQKLTQAGVHIRKLEQQVDIQRQRLGQYYQASFRVTELEQELARYREALDLSQRTKRQTELLALGAALSYRRLLNVPTHIEPGQEAWCSYADTESNETLAKAIMTARYFYTNLKELGMLS